MEHLSEITLLGVIGVNIVAFFCFCAIDTKTSKNPKRKNSIAGALLLLAVLILDFGCMVSFVKNGVTENGVVFIPFVPLMGYFLYESIKEFKTAR